MAYITMFPNAKLNILVSYGLRNPSIPDFLFKYSDNIDSIILDSGTFTLNFAKNLKTRERISFEGYRAYLKTLGHSFKYVFNYDSNFDADGKYDNDEHLKILQDDGHNVVPVVHSYKDEEVESYLNAGHKIIALGFSKTEKTRPNIERLCKLIHDNGAKAHVLGVSSWDRLAHTPIAYCDSSSWAQHGLFGCIQFWNETKQVFMGKDKTDTIRFPDTTAPRKTGHYYHDYKDQHVLYPWIKKTFGWDDYELLSKHEREKRVLINIHYYVELQRRLTEFHNNH